MAKQYVELSDADKAILESLLSKGSLKALKYKKATALLELDRGKTYGSLLSRSTDSTEGCE